jgi:hypothetical protein
MATTQRGGGLWRSRLCRLHSGPAFRHSSTRRQFDLEILSVGFEAPGEALGDPSYVAVFGDVKTSSMLVHSRYQAVQAEANPSEQPPRQRVASRLVARPWEYRRTHCGVLQRAGQQPDESGDFSHADWCGRDADVVAPVANDQLASLGMPRNSESPVIVTRVGDLNNRAWRSHS